MTPKEALEQGYTKVTLKITEKDLLEADIHKGDDCPITRALKRAGYDDIKDNADQLIRKSNVWWVIPTVGYKDLFDKVCYNSPKSGFYEGSTRAFQHTLYIKID